MTGWVMRPLYELGDFPRLNKAPKAVHAADRGLDGRIRADVGAQHFRIGEAGAHQGRVHASDPSCPDRWRASSPAARAC